MPEKKKTLLSAASIKDLIEELLHRGWLVQDTGEVGYYPDDLEMEDDCYLLFDLTPADDNCIELHEWLDEKYKEQEQEMEVRQMQKDMASYVAHLTPQALDHLRTLIAQPPREAADDER